MFMTQPHALAGSGLPVPHKGFAQRPGAYLLSLAEGQDQNQRSAVRVEVESSRSEPGSGTDLCSRPEPRPETLTSDL